MNKKWNREAFYRLLRFGRKSEGGWTDIDIDWKDGETIPDDNDIDILMAAPLMYEALAWIVGDCEVIEKGTVIADFGRITPMDKARAALKAAKGADDGER